MRRVTIQAPFTDGLVTDVPTELLGPRMASVAENMVIVDGVATRRRGFFSPGYWAAGTTDMASTITGVMSVRVALAGTSNLVLTSRDGAWAYPMPDAAGLPFRVLGAQVSSPPTVSLDYLPRCVYNDELILCDQSGTRGIRRWAGAGWNNGSNDSFTYEFRQFSATNKATIAMNTTAGSREFSYTLPGTNDGNIVALATLVGASQAGWFVRWRPTISGPSLSNKVANVSSTSTGTLVSAMSTGVWSTTLASVSMTGYAYPAVSIYSAGSVTAASGTVTGEGTEWSGGDWGAVYPDSTNNNDYEQASMLLIDGSTSRHRNINAVASATSMTVSGMPDVAAKSQYHITRGLPFKDACVYKGCLVGTGVPQYPTRVYICPPDWDLESPPGSVPPLRLEAASFQNADPNYFLVDFIDVPSSEDTDACVAVLPSAGPILVLKSDSLYGIYGDYPSFTSSLIAEGIGCLDRRSAISTKYGQFWAGRNGIYRYTPQTGPVDITAGRINGFWVNEVVPYAELGDTCYAMGVANGKLIVSASRGKDSNKVGNLIYDIETGAWDGVQDFIGIGAVSPAGATVGAVGQPGPESLVFAQRGDNSGATPTGRELFEFGPALAGDALAPARDAGQARPPTMRAVTSTGLARNEGIDGLSRLVDVSVTAEVAGDTDPSFSTFTELTASRATVAEALGAGLQRVRARVGTSSREHSIEVSVSSTGDTNGELLGRRYVAAVHQLTATFRDSRSRA